jgi:hypothetical protein
LRAWAWILSLFVQLIGGVALAQEPWHQQPIDPRSQIDFTAYTLGRGEARVGLASIDVAPVTRLQFGTAPLLDLVGIYNAKAKVTALEGERFAVSASGQLWLVPVTGLLEQFGGKNAFGVGRDVFVRRMTYSSASLGASAILHERWSVHGGLAYSRVVGTGSFDFRNLPVVVLPGAEAIGGNATLVPKVVGELVQARVATDVRFNRRDSVILQAALPLVASARGSVSGDLEGVPRELENLDVAVIYTERLKPSKTYRASVAYQMSLRQVDLRVGFGVTGLDKPLHRAWMLEVFDLAYRFGGRYRSVQP